MTINDLQREFEKNYIARRLRPSTQRGYTTNIRLHILPYLGGEDLRDLTVDDLDNLTEKLQTHLSNKSAVYVHATLRKMLCYAIRRGYLQNSPYEAFDMPRVEKFHYRTLKETEIRHALQLCQDTKLEVPVTMALCYGLRRGEILGLIPSIDLDAKNNVLHIQRTRGVEHGDTVISPCKTSMSDRYILIAPEHTKILCHTPQNAFACALAPYILDTSFKRFLKAGNLPDIRFHDLRHSYATLMLTKGINPKIVSAVLGHSGVDVTLDIYSHPDVSTQHCCIDVFQ